MHKEEQKTILGLSKGKYPKKVFKLHTAIAISVALDQILRQCLFNFFALILISCSNDMKPMLYWHISIHCMLKIFEF